MAKFLDNVTNILPTREGWLFMKDLTPEKLNEVVKELTAAEKKASSDPRNKAAAIKDSQLEMVMILFRKVLCDENGDAFTDIKDVEAIRTRVGIKKLTDIMDIFKETFLLGNGSSGTN